MFAKLKEQASAAANAAAEQAQKTASDIKARVDTAQAGKKLLDEGGEGIQRKLLAKQASRDAVVLDFRWSYYLRKVVDDYTNAAAKMKDASTVLPSDDQRKEAFEAYSKEYAERAVKLENLLVSLKHIPQACGITPTEEDALTLLTTKLQTMGLGSKIRSSLTAGTAGPGTEEASATNAVAEPEEKKGLLEKAQDKAKQVSDRAKERLDNAQTGKRIVDEGGPNIKAVLLAKKASLDSTAADKKDLDNLRKTIEIYKDAEAKLKEAMSEDKGDESPSFSSVVESHAARRAEFEAILSQIDPAPEPVPTHESEKDGILYLVTQLNIKDATDKASQAVVDAQGRIVEQTMSKAVTGGTDAASASDSKGTGKGGGYS